MPKCTGLSTCPSLDTLEGCERFYHRDLAAMDRLQLWAEEDSVRSRLAALLFAGQTGELLWVEGAVLVYECDWYSGRLAQIAHVRRRPERKVA